PPSSNGRSPAEASRSAQAPAEARERKEIRLIERFFIGGCPLLCVDATQHAAGRARRKSRRFSTLISSGDSSAHPRANPRRPRRRSAVGLAQVGDDVC